MYNHLKLEQKERIGILTIDRPDALNALNREVLSELDQALTSIAAAKNIKALLLIGAGRAFVAGADISGMQSMNSQEAAEFARFGQAVFDKLAGLPQPTIALVNGFALGGGMELALACDIRLASAKAKLGQPEISLGIIPGFGATQRLPRLVGPAVAKDLLFTGRMLSAEEALAVGLVNRVLPPDDLLSEGEALASQLAAFSGVAMELLKTAVDEGADAPLKAGLELEAKLFARCFDSLDQKEGMSAFLEKRKAQFKDC